MLAKFVISLLASANLLAYALTEKETSLDKSNSVGPGIRQLSPEEFRARIGGSSNKEPLHQFPDFGMSFQAADNDKLRREKEQREKEESIRKQQDDLRKLQEDFKRSQEDLRRQQDEYRKKEEEGKKRLEDEKNRREKEKRQQEKREVERRRVEEWKQKEDNLRRQIQIAENNNKAPPPPARIPNEQRKPVDNPDNKKKDDKKDDNKDKEDKKEEEKKNEKDDKKDEKIERGQIPKRNMPKRPKGPIGGGRIGGKPPTSNRGDYFGSSSAYNLSPSFESLTVAMFLLLALI